MEALLGKPPRREKVLAESTSQKRPVLIRLPGVTWEKREGRLYGITNRVNKKRGVVHRVGDHMGGVPTTY